ncbi:hypothetical protein KDK88_08125, partial [bacterium]|nr:hypothetical protein [bacterium]
MDTLLPPEILSDLRRRHAEPQRHYHTWAHVRALLDWLDRVRGDLADAAAVELAVLYHDAVYDPRAMDNEARSADLLLADLAGHVEPARLARARAMILATADHEPVETDDAGLANDGLANDAAHFLDMDLSILGAEPAAFDAYEAAIRREYAFV